MKKLIILSILLTSSILNSSAQQNNKSAARVWMDALIGAIKHDGLGPTIQSRNAFHLSAAMYDAWAVYDKTAEPYFLGKTINDYTFEFTSFNPPSNIDSARDVTIHYAAYGIITKRFNEYSSKGRVMDTLIFLFESLGLDASFTSTDYSTGSPAALGNYIAEKIYDFGLTEPIGDIDGYEANNYEPINAPLKPNMPGNAHLKYKNRWQPLSVVDYINNKGWDSTLLEWNNLLITTEDVFLTPHWGLVTPFAISESDKQIMKREGREFTVYNDPGPPPYMSPEKDIENSDAYKWNFALVTSWGSHCDPSDTTLIDISPGAIGPTTGLLPDKYSEYSSFFNIDEGGCKTNPHKKNPKTGGVYKPNLVKRGDYTRLIAEFWVDGVNTSTPPGHWIEMLNHISDHPDFEKKWQGKGKEVNGLEWDIKAYFSLTGALHDAGISAWSVKAYYDYIRPISALRWMAHNGQSSDSSLPRYHPEGISLMPGKIELIKEGDPLAGKDNKNLNKIKLYTWKGPDYIKNQKEDIAGVDWILADNWWPYQRYSFATPPFAGYVSGHSTYSIAASEVLTLITGDPFFPGGIFERTFNKNSFLEFEKGPSENITLQWATYREAADETCLSRIWGGIHPPVDDIQGRKIGLKVGREAAQLANKYFSGTIK